MGTLREILLEKKLTQAAAADLFEIRQPRVSDLMRGKIEHVQHRHAGRYARARLSVSGRSAQAASVEFRVTREIEQE